MAAPSGNRFASTEHVLRGRVVAAKAGVDRDDEHVSERKRRHRGGSTLQGRPQPLDCGGVEVASVRRDFPGDEVFRRRLTNGPESDDTHRFLFALNALLRLFHGLPLPNCDCGFPFWAGPDAQLTARRPGAIIAVRSVTGRLIGGSLNRLDGFRIREPIFLETHRPWRLEFLERCRKLVLSFDSRCEPRRSPRIQWVLPEYSSPVP